MPKYLARVLGLLLPLLLLSGCGNLNEDQNAPPTEGSQDEQTLASRRTKFSAEAGDAQAQSTLGFMYAEGGVGAVLPPSTVATPPLSRSNQTA